ncbi:hypothetical protein E8E12_005229 [Didymella heteroderae]|uniref:Metalloendopeptidase n=1 Tax=Didymella heteroderae TaxID=1769908 RepID=A0A9P4WJE1_9PLEO|nr:hypothetical protein E8E12_005229 [Didymella heteroderae]
MPRVASALKAQLAQPWPLVTVGTEQLRVMNYCYATKLYRDYLHCAHVNPALEFLGDKLGSPASSHGHSVAFKEAGYTGKDDKRKRADDAGRHEMVLGVDADAIEIAHELGHVLGMVHEQVRNDRDERVKYECCNVQGYADALSKAVAVESLSEADAHRRLCEDHDFALKHSFMGSQFAKNPRGKTHDESGEFDMDSIMLYGSDVFAEPACDTHASKCPLLNFRYCFETAKTKDALTCNGNFWKALAMWLKALSHPSEANGHSLAWQEANNGEMDTAKYKTHYCYNDLRDINEALGMVWNDQVPKDTLIIRAVVDATQSKATVGYKGVSKGKHPHELVIGTKASTSVIAHEIGHVMGMVHEHNRNDRDEYVRFNCHNVRGFYDALGRAMSARVPPAEARKHLCEDRDFATQYGFNSPGFLKNEPLSGNSGKWGALDEPGGYDIDSIMHYSSYAFGDIAACTSSQDYCPLLEIQKDAQGNEIGTRRIPRPEEPSKGDAAWVKRNYCYPADADCSRR